VAHSLSPLIHNEAFRAAGLNAVYLPFRVARADLATKLDTEGLAFAPFERWGEVAANILATDEHR